MIRLIVCILLLFPLKVVFSQPNRIRIINAVDTIHHYSDTRYWKLQIENNLSSVICLPQTIVYNDACADIFDIGYELLQTTNKKITYVDCMFLTHRFLDGTEWTKDSILPAKSKIYPVDIPFACIQAGQDYKIRFVVDLDPLNTGLGKWYSSWYPFFVASDY